MLMTHPQSLRYEKSSSHHGKGDAPESESNAMASYEIRTSLTMENTLLRAREFFEAKHGLTVIDRLGALYRWRGPEGDVIEMRLFPVKEAGTRVEIEALHSDELVRTFVMALPQPGLLDELKKRWRSG